MNDEPTIATDYCTLAPGHPWHGPYHDQEYGFPAIEDHVLFERLVLEINQAGLSWLTILKKRNHFRQAYDNFDVDRVAAYDEAERRRLLSDKGIIRNRLKVNAAIVNAQKLVEFREQYGSFRSWLMADHAGLDRRKLASWVKLFKSNFKFVGPEIVNEFLMSTGYLAGAHRTDCPVYTSILKLEPDWLRWAD